MSRTVRMVGLAVLGVAAMAVGVYAGSLRGASDAATAAVRASGSSAGASSVTVLFGLAPDSLDPGFAYTTQAAEPDWIVYTPLVTYAHAEGIAGGLLIPGLATDLGTVSPDGKTYTYTLRSGLVYSNGVPVKASDFPYTIERAIRLGWGGKGFYTDVIVGAAAYDRHQSTAISGITTDDGSRMITIRLTRPYGALPNVLAFPSSGLVPSGTPMLNMSNNPPPGDGPYMFSGVTPNQGFTVIQNPRFEAQNIAGIPPGHVNQVVVRYVSSPRQETTQVLDNTADVFDPADELQGSLLGEIQRQASGRYKQQTTAQTFYFFLNTRTKPFSSQLAREAVVYALDDRHLARLSGGWLEPGCFFLPPQIVGHPPGSCPYHDPNGPPNIAKARALVKRARLVGTRVTVWGENVSPRKEYVDYYTRVLKRLGFKATEKLISPAAYFPTIAQPSRRAQTGFADWQQDFPNPVDFYQLLDGSSIQPANNQNFSLVTDPHIQSELAALDPVPASQLPSEANRWQALDSYVAHRAYEAVFGYNKSPELFSNRIDTGSVVFHPFYLNDWTSLAVK